MNLENEITNLNNKLENIKTDKDVPYFNFENQTFIAKPCNVYDGDTFSVIFDFKGELIKYRCRCYGYDTPEMRPSKKNPNRLKEKELAYAAKQRMVELLEAHPSKLIKIQCLKFDKYGRILINAWNNVNEKSINEIMVEEGHGKWYDGGKKDTNW
jgi:endonuclease YncB( thermonuclease family)